MIFPAFKKGVVKHFLSTIDCEVEGGRRPAGKQGGRVGYYLELATNTEQVV